MLFTDGKTRTIAKTAWVYGNVVTVNCSDYVSDVGVFNQFNDHYVSLYSHSRCNILAGNYATSFDTYDKAAAHRRHLVSTVGGDVAPILINDFEYYCEN